jgi:hypothetical protein
MRARMRSSMWSPMPASPQVSDARAGASKHLFIRTFYHLHLWRKSRSFCMSTPVAVECGYIPMPLVHIRISMYPICTNASGWHPATLQVSPEPLDASMHSCIHFFK